MNVGKRIKLCRKGAGLTLKQMSELVGVSSSFLSDIENGRSNPSLQRLETVAEKLGTSVSWLMGEEDIREPSGTYRVSEWVAALQRLMSFPEFKEVIGYLEDFPDWDSTDRDELMGYLRAKKLFREKNKSKKA